MDRADLDHRPRRLRLEEFLQRITLTTGSLIFALTRDAAADDVEAFLIAYFEITASPDSFHDRNAAIRPVVEHAITGQAFEAAQCGVEIRLSHDACEIRHRFTGSLSKQEVAATVLTVLEEFEDPAGMIIGGMAKVFDTSSFKLSSRPSVPPRLI